MKQLFGFYIVTFVVATLCDAQRYELISCRDIEKGGYLSEDCHIQRHQSPILIRDSLLVMEKVTLRIDPGVEVRFAPRAMLAVNGTLLAEGTKDARIKFTRSSGGAQMEPIWAKDARLVDEWTVKEGRLQLLYKNKWRGVCANNVNWTQADTNVTCRQLGFEWGNFSFMSFAANESLYMLYYKPGCSGKEFSIFDCPNRTKIEIGSKICYNQQTIHLKCYGHAPNTVGGFWWGLEFYNSTYQIFHQGATYINESASRLVHVDVEYAGVDPVGEPVPAIRASPHAPALVHVGIRNCALDGTNFTDIKSHTNVHNSVMENNRGHGLIVESHYGRVVVTDSIMRNNQGNGFKAKFIDGHYFYMEPRETFCLTPDQTSPAFPIVISGIPPDVGSPPCSKLFRTTYGEILTLNVLEMNIEPDAFGEISVYDGTTTSHPLITTWRIINATLPQGVTSTRQHMLVTFTWSKPRRRCETVKECVKFTIMVDSGPELVKELFVNNTLITNNTQHGVFLENVRNYAFFNHSSLTHNKYGAGLRVFGGGGDIHVNTSHLDFNQDNGVNITYAGGMRIFNMSTFNNNFGNGINITFNETRVDNQTRYARHQLTEVMTSKFEFNEGLGIFVGNFCQTAKHVVNNSFFISNGGGGVVFESCYKLVPEVNYTVSSNVFEYNRGFYVANVRLTERSSHQKMKFTHNKFEKNVIEGAFPTINERTRAYAVAVVSSSNILFRRNILNNPSSRFEVATHLLDRSARLKTDECYWGRTHRLLPDEGVNYTNIIHRIFDQFSRYNLATIQYHPALKYPQMFITDPRVCCSTDQAAREIQFDRGTTIGGRLGGLFRTDPAVGLYHVDRDITILPEGTLEVLPGTTLEFENAIGMLVHGMLRVRGEDSREIEMILANTSMATRVPMSGMDGREVEALLFNGSTAVNSSLIRLVDGRGEYEGRLEVRPTPDDPWGTVCNKGWTITDANVVCQSLGLVVHPDDWIVYNNVPGAPTMPIYRSNVECTDLDMDILRCRADGPADHSCKHDRDVYVMCHPPTWAGIQFLATAKRSEIKHTVISHAGLMDPSRIFYSPAIKIHYNVHNLEYINVTHCASTGIEIFYNDVYTNAKVSHSNVMHNLGNGISTRYAFFKVDFSTISNNYRAGIEYNPYITTYEAQQVRLGISDKFTITKASRTMLVENEGWRFMVTTQNSQEENHLYEVAIEVHVRHRIVLDILDYSPDTATENVTVYDSAPQYIREGTKRWQVDKDMVDFPVESAGTVVTLRWHVKGKSSGRLTLVARSKPYTWDFPWGKFEVKNCTVANNRKGIETRHYNQPSNEYQDLFFRFRWQPITMHGVIFRDNKEEALNVPSRTKYHENYMPTLEEMQRPYRIAEIMYTIEFSEFTGNTRGITGEHNHVEYSNNVWLWEVTNNVFERNKGGGFMIQLPRVNLMYQEVYNHTVDVNDTIFRENEQFEFRIDGFYCNSSMARNLFQKNNCKLGCISITGTEKDMDIHDNEFYENVGKYIILFDMTSHTPYNKWVDARFMYNNIKRNRKLANIPSTGPSSSPATFTVGVRGVQNITINRNLFGNHLDYELIGGQASSALETFLDVTENFWGTTDQPRIRELIFDFDDWNSYAIAEYFPHLMFDNFDSPRASGGKYQPRLDLSKPIGGRISKPLTLAYRPEPYIVKSDLTIMPTASLIVEAGVEMQFFPNVGILVLGSFRALGKQGKRTKFGPVPTSLAFNRNKRELDERWDDVTARNKRSTIDESAAIKAQQEILDKVRLVGGAKPYEGFIQIYNTTEKRWTIICDHNFNDRTAEVACRTMKRESSNVAVRRSRYYDIFVLGYPIMHEQRTEWFWRRTFLCDGSEGNLDQCRYRTNENIRRCMNDRQYVFVRCGPRNIPDKYQYWGNIRFSTKEYESGRVSAGDNVLEFADIYGAGILHEEKAAAVQAIHRVPETNYVRITNCASNGYDYVAPAGEFFLDNNYIENNNGYGIGSLVLNGESDYVTPLSTFRPLVESNIPYHVFGLVRMCTTEKLIMIRDRILLYYKYNFKTIDCIKIMRSYEPKKRVAVRFLQLNMYNDTFYKNAVEIYNGEIFEPASLIGEVHSNSSEWDRRRKYETAQYFDTMGIRVTGSPAYGTYGFIAEVVTVPYTPSHRPDLDLSRNRQRIWRTSMTGNEGGGFRFENVGELNPTVVVEACRIQGGGLALLNITAPPIMYMNIQNSRLMTIANNFMAHNAGGIRILAHTQSMSSSIYTNITNNYIVHNTHGSALHVEGHHFQGFEVRNNFIGHNEAEYRNVTAMFGVRLNFSSNVLWKNQGNCILNVSVPEQISVHQRFLSNAFDDNEAIGEKRTTIYMNSAKHLFHYNFLFNRQNIFEMVTFNRTKFTNVGFPGYIAGETYGDDERYPRVDARYNWWGQDSRAHVRGRIWDRDDDDNLIRVTYDPWEKTNKTVVDGRCQAGWRRFHHKCYIYMGGVVPFYEAWKECRHGNSRLAFAKNRATEDLIGELIASSQGNYNEFWKTWVDHEHRDTTYCPVFRNYRIEMSQDCNQLLPFVCEQDPYIRPELEMQPIIIATSVTGGVLFVVLVIIFCAVFKSRKRNEERMERRNSLRASMRGSRATLNSTKNGSEIGSMKPRPPMVLSKMSNAQMNLQGATLDSSTDTFDKTIPSRPITPGDSILNYSTDSIAKPRYDTSSFNVNDSQAVVPGGHLSRHQENEIANIINRPAMYGSDLRSDGGFGMDDRSIDRSRMGLARSPGPGHVLDHSQSPLSFSGSAAVGLPVYGQHRQPTQDFSNPAFSPAGSLSPAGTGSPVSELPPGFSAVYSPQQQAPSETRQRKGRPPLRQSLLQTEPVTMGTPPPFPPPPFEAGPLDQSRDSYGSQSRVGGGVKPPRPKPNSETQI